MFYGKIMPAHFQLKNCAISILIVVSLLISLNYIYLGGRLLSHTSACNVYEFSGNSSCQFLNMTTVHGAIDECQLNCCNMQHSNGTLYTNHR
jgi:hypothetical protein